MLKPQQSYNTKICWSYNSKPLCMEYFFLIILIYRSYGEMKKKGQTKSYFVKLHHIYNIK